MPRCWRPAIGGTTGARGGSVVSNAAKMAEKPTSAVDDLRSLINRAQKGDESTLPEVQRILHDLANVDRFGGDMALRVESSFIHTPSLDVLPRLCRRNN